MRAEGEEGLIMTHFWLRDWPRGQKEWKLGFEFRKDRCFFVSLSLEGNSPSFDLIAMIAAGGLIFGCYEVKGAGRDAAILLLLVRNYQ